MKYIKPVLAGTAAGAFACAFVLTLLSLLLSLQNIPQIIITPMSLAALAVGAFTGGFVAARAAHEKGLALGLACGALLFAAVCMLGQGIKGNEMGVMALVKLGIALVCGALGGVLSVNHKKRRK